MEVEGLFMWGCADWNRIECFGGVNDGVKGNLWQEIAWFTGHNPIALQREDIDLRRHVMGP